MNPILLGNWNHWCYSQRKGLWANFVTGRRFADDGPSLTSLTQKKLIKGRCLLQMNQSLIICIENKMTKWSSWKIIVSFNYLLIAKGLLPTHADNLSAVIYHTISSYESQLLQIGKYIYTDDLFWLNANSQRGSSWNLASLLCFCCPLVWNWKGWQNLIIVTNVLLVNNLWLSLWVW